ncbi:carboxypeptidase-like regulatory domain-containing protein [Leptospira perdikensis]|uniref:Carboxypeptidase regulatory-like domain-containing protein n=1 Tax=Leptospira perdikensis TaxID=2484948 RepID=A0A4R9JAW4_9LEPT|nr:carboxypeptidase-like regulatory domain-containing protein [Leptospira perdikensis]TGL35706.1 carboxypeptidase regulatory-like domain-containing protein [Leptospira perdikensis]
MNRHPKLPTSLVLICLWFLLGNCYFNPLVQPIVNPEVEEGTEAVPFLGIAAVLSGSKILITGQVVNANGSAVANGTLTILSRTNQESGLANTITLDGGGRFYQSFSIGETAIKVFDQSGTELFTFKLSITGQGIASLAETSVAGAGVINIEFYMEGSIPAYIDIASTSPIVEGTTFTTWPTYLYISFSENLEVPSNMQSFLDANVITNPTIPLIGTNSDITNNILTIYNSGVGAIGPNTYTFGSGIKSTSGKSLKPRTLTFLCQPSCNGS